MRFSLRWLFGIVALVALGCFCLAYSSLMIQRVVAAATYTLLVLSVVAAIVSRGDRQRAFWTGVAITGLGYVTTYYFPKMPDPPPWELARVVLDWLYDVALRKEPMGAAAPRGYDEYFRTGYSLIVIVVALAGGLFAFWLRGRPRD